MKREELATPAYVVMEKKLKENLSVLQALREETGVRILLAQKAFSMFRLYPLIGKYLDGCTASGLYEARLGAEEMGKENHVYAPAFGEEEMKELVGLCGHISFNSISQLERHRPVWEPAVQAGKLSVGLRVNPEYSTQSDPIYDPCAPGSRLGIRAEDFPEELPPGVTGLHMHTLCEQDFAPLEETFQVFRQSFGKFLPMLKWLNLGGGHHITREDYDREGLTGFLKEIREEFPELTVYLEPGEAIALQAGVLVTTVLDVVETGGFPVLILDTSAACHMPDVLEMPYRPPLFDAGMPGEKIVTCRLSSRTCLAGDIIGDYSFDVMPQPGDRLTFGDMAIYSMVKNNTFNGMPLPDIVLEHEDGDCEVVRHFGYEDFKGRLS